MNNVFDRSVISALERPASQDVNRAQSEIDRTIRDLFARLCLGRTSVLDDTSRLPFTGFIGESLKVKALASPAMGIRIRPGLGFLYDTSGDEPQGIAGLLGAITGLDDLSHVKPLPLLAEAQIIGIGAPAAGNTRIDIVEINYARVLTDAASRDVLNTGTGIFVPTIVQKTLQWILDGSVGTPTTSNSTTAIGYKMGGATTGTPTPPTNTPGYTTIAQILVSNATTQIDASIMQDLRSLLFPFNEGIIAGTISANATGPAISLSQLVAPPGMSAVAVIKNGTNLETDLYLFGGNLPSGVTPVIAVHANQAGNVGGYISSGPTAMTIDAGAQTDIQGASASPAGFKVAVGQPCYKAKLKCTISSGVVVYTFSAALNGG